MGFFGSSKKEQIKRELRGPFRYLDDIEKMCKQFSGQELNKGNSRRVFSAIQSDITNAKKKIVEYVDDIQS
ncbi:hypothetical protein GOV10_06245 [Candidatus Woesearchaeota archaeon]|nr:hypothetical protein [Candidatus Woesearchaeota archaeon]